MTKSDLWFSVPLSSGMSTNDVSRPLWNVEFEPELFEEIVRLENHGVAEAGSLLDRIQSDHFPFLGARTALTLVFVTREIFKECTWRLLELEEKIRDANLERRFYD